jgi:hypothetical protein
MATDEIRDILRQYDAGLQLVSVQELEKGKSYNNRIYFLRVRAAGGFGDTGGDAETAPVAAAHEHHELVLKVTDRFWGTAKVHNEVACLHLLETCCPAVSAPRVLAWAERHGADGGAATTTTTMQILTGGLRHGSSSSSSSRLRVIAAAEPRCGQDDDGAGGVQQLLLPPDRRVPREVVLARPPGRGTSAGDGVGGGDVAGARLWILMTRLPGEPIDTARLDAAGARRSRAAARVSRLALAHAHPRAAVLWEPPLPVTRTTKWTTARRHQAPWECAARHGAGGVGAAHARQTACSATTSAEPAAWPRCNHYYKLRLEDKERQLETKAAYAPNRDLAGAVRGFVARDLVRLPGFSAGSAAGAAVHVDLSFAEEDARGGAAAAQDAGGGGGGPFVFTHYDLSPRNVLVSAGAAATAPTITGIVDFEFAGFFSPLEEFVNDQVNNDGDWPPAVYQAYLELARNGVATPLMGVGTKQAKDEEGAEIWRLTIVVEKLLQCIAPWWLPGGRESEALKEELDKARAIVLETLDLLVVRAEKEVTN